MLLNAQPKSGDRFPLVACPKKRPHRLVTQKAKAGVDKIDREEKAKVKARSGGRCEVRERGSFGFAFCHRPATQNHHLIGGIGRRNRGRSILAAHRLHVCDRCHKDITGNVLIPIDGTKKESAASVRYARIR